MVRGPLDESRGSSPLQGHSSWLMCEVALTVEQAKLAFVKLQAKRLVERALDSPSMEEPANRTLSRVDSSETGPEEIVGRSLSAIVVQSFRVGRWLSQDGVDKASNSEQMTHNGVAATLAKANLQSECVTNAQPYSSTVHQFHYIKFGGICQDNLILQITEGGRVCNDKQTN